MDAVCWTLLSGESLFLTVSAISRGRKLSFPEIVSRDTRIRIEDLGTTMKDREVWCGVNSVLSTTVDWSDDDNDDDDDNGDDKFSLH